jgi:hypothetical protein
MKSARPLDFSADLTAEALEHEFIPPLMVLHTEPDAWCLPWEQQLDAACAWQEAGGNADSEWDAWQPALHRSGSVSRAPDEAPTMATIVRMTTTVVAVRERLLRVQTEATEVARAEMALRRAPSADAANNDGTSSRRSLEEQNSERVLALARACVDMLDAARGSVAALAGMSDRRASRVAPFVERRRANVVIGFPDRRTG